MGKKQIRRLGVREARRRLAEILADAGVGKTTIITVREKAVAAVISGQCLPSEIDAARAATSRKVPFGRAMRIVVEEDDDILRELAKR